MDNRLLAQLALTALAFAAGAVVNSLLRRSVERFGQARGVRDAHQKVLCKIIKYMVVLLTAMVLVFVWGVNFASLWVLGTSILGFLGVAMFASWSFLSNIMAALIMFFTMPFGIGDRVSFKDGDVQIDGVIDDMTLFYVYLRDSESTRVSIPNNLIIQKPVRVHSSIEK